MNRIDMFLTVAETADLLRTSPKAIYAMKARGQLPGVKCIGRRLLVHRAVLLDWLNESCASLPGGSRQ